MSAKPIPLSQADLPEHHESKYRHAVGASVQWAPFFGCTFQFHPVILGFCLWLGLKHQPNICCMDFMFELCFPNLDSLMA